MTIKKYNSLQLINNDASPQVDVGLGIYCRNICGALF